jgi:hypothetical protein
VSWRKTTSVQVSDPAAAIAWAEQNGHTDCVKYNAPEISKTELAALLKNDIAIPGAELVAGSSMSVK